MYIAYGSSNEYAPHTGISLFSLLENNRDIEELKIIIMDFGIQQDNKDKIQEVCHQFHREIIFIQANSTLTTIGRELKLLAFRGSWSAYSKAFIDVILKPYEIRRVLYIDSDTIIQGSIRELLSIDLENHAMAAVVGVNMHDKLIKRSYDTFIATRRKYFNSGVIIYDLENWDRLDCNNIIKKGSLKNPHFEIADQTMLSAYLPEAYVLKLPLKYNYWGHVYPRFRVKYQLSYGGYYSQEEIEEAIQKPIIVHYKGPLAHPWIDGSTSQLRNLYIYYKNLSPWKMYPYGNMNDVLVKPQEGIFKGIRRYFPYLKDRIPFQWMDVIYKMTARLKDKLVETFRKKRR